jgi:FemAB-related protein (PEP-CTERM system-associated)
MTLSHFSASNISDYQSFVDNHPNATPYHESAWGLAVEKSYGFNIQYFGLAKNNEIVAVMPGVLMKTLKGKRLLCSLPYCDMGGILADTDTDREALKALVTKYVTSEGWEFEYRDSVKFTDDETQEVVDGTKVRMLYELLNDVDDQMASFKPKLRSQIKKAIKNGISARVVANPGMDALDEFYEVFAINMRDLGSPVHSKEWFKAIFTEYGNNAFLVLVNLEDKCVGGGVVIHTKDKAVIPWASTLRDYNKLAPNMLLYWEVLSEVIRRGINNFDFGRSGYNEGTYRFKKQWGAQACPLQWETLSNKQLVNEVLSEKSSIRASVENMWQKMPVGLTTTLGPKIRKYISL